MAGSDSKRFKFTERRIERLTHDPDGPARQIVWDTEIPGHGVRLYASGRKAFVLQYGHSTRRKLKTLGQVGVLTLHQAREMAREDRVTIAKGGDPLEERRAARHADAIGRTVDDLIEAYLEAKKPTGNRARDRAQGRWSESHYAESRRRLQGAERLKEHGRADKAERVTVSAKIGGFEPSEVRRVHINEIHAEITGRGSPVEANRVRTLICSMFEWAADHGYVDEDHPNPARKNRSGSGRNEEASRDRVLTQAEATGLLRAADKLGHGALVRLWLLTGLRKNELLQRHWSDVDLDAATITITETKNGERHVAFLSRRAVELLEPLKPKSEDLPLFPGRAGSPNPRRDFKGPWGRILEEAGIEDLTIHDLRRTFSTWLEDKVGRATLKALLNHKSVRDVTDIYARSTESKMREAAEEMARMLADVEPSAASHSPPDHGTHLKAV